MKNRISALCLCGAMCFSMMGTAMAADLDIIEEGGKLVLTGSDSNFKPNTDYKVPVIIKTEIKTEVGDKTEDVQIGEVDIRVDENGNIKAELWDKVDGAEIGIRLPGMNGDAFYGKTDSPPPDDTNTPTNPSRPGRPVIDDDDDDDDDDSSTSISSSGGGAGGASSKYIKNESRGNQTITPVTTPSNEWTSTTNVPQFTDVASSDWFYNAVQFVGQNGMMAGSNGRFSPYDKLTRGMMAQILYNMEGAPGGTAAAFPDVSSSDWFANASSWSASCGYMSGYSNGYFGPLDPITREQLASILYRYASAKGYDVTASAELSFTDGGTTSSWAVPAMKWAVGAGVLSGKTGVGGSRLDPLGNATRAEVAQILMNFSQKIAK